MDHITITINTTDEEEKEEIPYHIDKLSDRTIFHCCDDFGLYFDFCFLS